MGFVQLFGRMPYMDFTEYFLYVKKAHKKLAGGSYFMEYILICL